MRASWGVFSCVLLAPACLATPSPPSGDRDAAPPGAADAGGSAKWDADTGPPACLQVTELDIDFTDASSLTGWSGAGPEGCSDIVGGALQFENDGTPRSCRRHRDLGLDLADRSLAIRVADAGIGTSLTFSIVLHEDGVTFNKRTWYYIERNGTLLRLGRCVGGSCDDMALGLVTFEQPEHVHWRFRHDALGQELLLEVSADGVQYKGVGAEADIPAAKVRCVGIDLASYEQESGRAGTVAFDDLRTE